jgi:hypothetical protein
MYSIRRQWAEEDISYHCQRADEELDVAQRANCMISRRFHFHLAALHLDRAYSEAPFRRATETAASLRQPPDPQTADRVDARAATRNVPLPKRP